MAGLCHDPHKKGQDALRVFLRLRFAAPPEHPECVSQAEPLLQTDCCTTQILADYTDLEPEDIRACLAYAARYLDHPVLVAA